MPFMIITDSCCDLPLSYIKQHNLMVLPFSYNVNNKDYYDENNTEESYKNFYQNIRNGCISKTSQVNSEKFIELFQEFLKQGTDIIYISFSSNLSGTFNSSNIAKQVLSEKFPERKITVIDSLSASMGQGLLVYYAVKMMEDGKTYDEITKWVEGNKLKLNHWFTVEDLFNLKRGGRISAATAVIGSLLNIKPVLHVDNDGKLIPVENVKGRKRSLNMLVDKYIEMAVSPENQTVFISHGDAEKDALYVKEQIEKKSKFKECIINYVGPVIGSHSGPGTVALFFLGNSR